MHSSRRRSVWQIEKLEAHPGRYLLRLAQSSSHQKWARPINRQSPGPGKSSQKTVAGMPDPPAARAIRFALRWSIRHPNNAIPARRSVALSGRSQQHLRKRQFLGHAIAQSLSDAKQKQTSRLAASTQPLTDFGQRQLLHEPQPQHTLVALG